MTQTVQRGRTGWSPEIFAKFWANPDPSLVPAMLTDDIVGYWPGADEPVRGRDAYTRAIADVIALVPGMHLTVEASATVDDLTFVSWVMHGTGANGPFTVRGIDRVRMRDGLVCENLIRFDPAEVRARLTGEAPAA
jgi:hypothetical protein